MFHMQWKMNSCRLVFFSVSKSRGKIGASLSLSYINVSAPTLFITLENLFEDKTMIFIEAVNNS